MMIRARSCLGYLFGVGLLLGAGAAIAQTAPTTQSAPAAQATASSAAPAASDLTFDVASVRPSGLDQATIIAGMQAGKMPNVGMHINGLRAEFNYLRLKDLITVAYKMKDYQITGPDWMDKADAQRFDIVARLPEGSSKDDVPKMLQALLAERFKLVVHRETKEHPVLALVVGKGGPKMKESTEKLVPIDPDAPLKPGEMQMDGEDGPMRVTVNMKDGSSTINMGAKGTIRQRMDTQTQTFHIDADTTTMAGFADMLTSIMKMGGSDGKQVVDMTGLKGNYQVAVEISQSDIMAMARAQGYSGPGGGGTTSTAASDPGGVGTSAYSAVEKMGLKLEPRKAPVEQLVVDSAEKIPTEN
jgi:uncharacterized protein (TIGR03435 family)